MARTFSLPVELGQKAPDFNLPAANPNTAPSKRTNVSLQDYDDADALVVVFTCNHCPYAQHVENTLIRLANENESRGVRFVAISSNDTQAYPAASFERMAARTTEKEYPFPYLFDETQEVAAAYGAVCTPDPFVFDREGRLVYHGRIDATRPGQGTSTGDELQSAIDNALSGADPLTDQFPAMGCNIKWKPGNQPTVSAGPVPAEYQTL